MFSKVIVPILLVVAFGALFFGTYLLNKKTPKPEGCEDLSESCKTCPNTSCSIRDKGE